MGLVGMEVASGQRGVAMFALLRGTVGSKEEWWSVISETEKGTREASGQFGAHAL